MTDLNYYYVKSSYSTLILTKNESKKPICSFQEKCDFKIITKRMEVRNTGR